MKRSERRILTTHVGSLPTLDSVDAMVAKRACGKARVEAGKEMLLSIVSMLTKLVEKFEGGGSHEEEGGGRVRQAFHSIV